LQQRDHNEKTRCTHMSQNHIIKTQILDFTLATQAGSFNIQNELGILYNDSIVPIIEECCDSLSDSSEIHRIEHLEIDLGNIHPNNLEYEIKTKIAEKFPDILKKKIADIPDHFYSVQGHDEIKDNSILSDKRKQEILEYFLKKGRLPWWVNKNENTDIPGIMESLLENNPAAIKEMMCIMKEDQCMIERTVHRFNDNILARILNLSSESETTNAIVDIITASKESEIIKAFGAHHIRSTIWKYVLVKYFNTTQYISNTYDLLHSITLHLAEMFQADYKQLQDNIEKQLKRKGYHSYKTTGTILLETKDKKEVSVDAQHNKKTKENSFNDSLKTIHNTLNTLVTSDDKNDENISLKAAIEHFEKDLAQITNLINNSNRGIINNHITIEEVNASLFKITSELLRQNIPDKEKESIWRAIQTLVLEVNSSPDLISINDSEAKNKYQFSDTEEMYINNAGVILFWPYINRLFEQCGLVKDKRFIDREKQNHAVFLLQYLSAGEEGSPEYELMLNKILCGIHPDFPVHADTGITEAEKTECSNLINSLIQNWSALKNMSVQGLRDTFIARNAMISFRDEQYMMRVEEKGYDVLIDKMPWGVGTIKLPWMNNILFVEWRL
jgi:hypothetical protein